MLNLNACMNVTLADASYSAWMLYYSLTLCLCIQISSFVVSVLRLLFIIILHGNDGNQLWLSNIFQVSGAVRVLVGTNNIHASSTIYGRSILSLYNIEKDSILKMSSNRQSSVLRLHNLAWCQNKNCHYIIYSKISKGRLRYRGITYRLQRQI